MNQQFVMLNDDRKSMLEFFKKKKYISISIQYIYIFNIHIGAQVGKQTRATHVNDWEPAVYVSCMSQNLCLFHVSNLSVRNLRIFLLMHPGSLALTFREQRARNRCSSG